MATVKIVLYTSKTLKDGTHPVVLLITHQYKRKKISSGFSCSKQFWDSDLNLFNSDYPKYKKRNKVLSKMLFRAEDVIERFKELGIEFSMDEFESKYRGISSSNVFQYFDKVIQELQDTGKAGNSKVYKQIKSVLRNYVKNDDLLFTAINYEFLKNWEIALRKKGVKDNSINYYMRTLKALINRAIKDKKCPQECYPFKEYQTSKLKNETTPRAITKVEIEKIQTFIPNPNSKQELSIDLFLFSFYTRGMNFTDIAKLKWENISDNRILYTRSKNGKPFSIKIHPPVKIILDKYKQLNSGNIYIFPILDSTYDTPIKIRDRISSGLKRMNLHFHCSNNFPRPGGF